MATADDDIQTEGSCELASWIAQRISARRRISVLEGKLEDVMQANITLEVRTLLTQIEWKSGRDRQTAQRKCLFDGYDHTTTMCPVPVARKIKFVNKESRCDSF